MSSKPFLRRKLAVAIGSATLLLPALSGISAIAQAQEANVLEEVVVTARKREENLQDTPIAVSAISGSELKDAGVVNIQNLSASVPGLTLEAGAGTGGAASPYIRGVGQRDTNETLEGGVAIYIDGVYMGRPDGALMDMVDVSGVQVLRGPQGTLFGKNSTGGAMVVTTNKPNERFEGDVAMRVGNYGRLDGQLTVNVPLIDNTLYSRFSLSSVKRDGFTKQVYAPLKADNSPNPFAGLATGVHADDEDRLTGQAQLRWLASDTVTVDTSYNWGKQRESGRGSHCHYAMDSLNRGNFFPGMGQAALPFTISLVAGGPLVTAGLQANPNSDFRSACRMADNYHNYSWTQLYQLQKDMSMGTQSSQIGNVANNEYTSSAPGLYTNDVSGLSTTVNWDIGAVGAFDGVNFKSITAWRSVDTVQNQDIDGTAMPLVDRTWSHPRMSDQYSQEFQLNWSAMDSRLNGVTGLYLYNEETHDGLQDSFVGPFDMSNAGIIDQLVDLASQDMGNGTFMSNYQSVWFADRAQKLDTLDNMAAAYTQLTFDVNEIVSVTGGLRYNWEKKGLKAAFYQNQANAGSGILEASSDVFPDAAAGGLTASQILMCPNACDISVITGGAPGSFLVGQLIPQGTGFFVPRSMGMTDAQAAAYVGSHMHKQWIGTKHEENIDRSWTPMFNIKFKATDSFLDATHLDSAMGYFTYSKGFKSGGIVPASINTLQAYQPEQVDNYEVGFKFDALDRTLRNNISLYYMDYNNIQVTVATADPYNPVAVGILQSNAGTASISGVENELTWLPFQGMMVQWNVAYTDASYQSFMYGYVSGLGKATKFDRANPCATGAPYGNGCGAEKMPFVSQWTSFIALQYSFFGDFGALTPRWEVSYKSPQNGSFDFASFQSGDWKVREIAIQNFRLSWELPDDKTRVTAWIKNIENKQYKIGTSPIPEILGGGSFDVSAPRTYGVDFQYHF